MRSDRGRQVSSRCALTRAGREAIEQRRYAAFAEQTARAMREGDEIGPPNPKGGSWKPPSERHPKKAPGKPKLERTAKSEEPAGG